MRVRHDVKWPRPAWVVGVGRWWTRGEWLEAGMCACVVRDGARPSQGAGGREGHKTKNSP